MTFVMNITDVDDKIILAARQQFLLSQWLDEHKIVNAEVRNTTESAWRAYMSKNLPLIQSLDQLSANQYDLVADKVYGHVLQGKNIANDGAPPGDAEAKVKMHLRTAQAAAQALGTPDPSLDEWSAKASGVLLPYIDSQRKHTITGRDHDIFTKLTKRYEQRFFDDMQALNVRYPDKLTRVTEYGPQIVDFVKRIETNGFGYEHDGSVYYDIAAWEGKGGVYARLEHSNRNDKALQADGEGALAAKKTDFKRSDADFALWKASKEGEPSWESPWGEGRPGWHIECSAMASDVLGEQFDIHSGGIDLAFPHHDNELAQSEAYWCKQDPDGKIKDKQWVNYFLHMGHLSIQGSKMSKSLKNFTTIREALAKGDWTPRSLRIVFLLGAWKEGLEITPDFVKAARSWQEYLDNFFIRIRDIEQRQSRMNGVTNGVNGLALVDGIPGGPMMQELEKAKENFDAAMCDSFNTPAAMRVIENLILTYNQQKPYDVPDAVALKIGEWITEMVVIFGLDADYEAGRLGWSGLDIPKDAKAFVIPLSQLRDRVREMAKVGGVDAEGVGKLSDKDTKYSPNHPYANAFADFQRKIHELLQAKAAPKEYLAACDHVRDKVLWDLGIYLEDRDGLPALVRPLSDSMREDRAHREAEASKKAEKKAADKAAAEAKEREKNEKGKLSHLEMFRTSEFSAWDADGLPTHDAEGKEVAKSRAKKLRKDWERQKKAHEAWQASQRQ